MIESTGVAAIGVHGRTKDERPGHANHDDIIREVVQVGDVIVAASGHLSDVCDHGQIIAEGLLLSGDVERRHQKTPNNGSP